MKKHTWLRRAVLLILAASIVLSMAACGCQAQGGETTPTTESIQPTESVQQMQEISLPSLAYPGGKTEAQYTLEPDALFTDGISGTYRVDCDDADAVITEENGKYLLTFRTTGDKIITVKRTEDGAQVVFTLKVEPQIGTQLVNGDFENGYAGWNMTDGDKAAYIIYDSPVDIWENPVNATNHYLYGFAQEAYVDANFTSSLFKLADSGIITWKMAGNCTQALEFVLMQYNEDGEDVEIAKFNNWYYNGSNESGFIFRQYYYQVDMETYADAVCYFVVKDADDGANGFGFVNLDDIITHYPTAPDVSGMLEASWCVKPGEALPDTGDTSADAFPEDLSTVPKQMVNGDFESGYEGWYMTTEEKAAYSISDSKTDIWGNPVGGNGHYLNGYANESFANANFHSSLFKAEGTGYITWKMAGNCTENLQFILMQYHPDGEDVQIAKFNNWYYTESKESGFIFRQYYYRLDMTKYADSYCYFVVKDTDDGKKGFGFVNLDDIVTYYESVPDLRGMLGAGYSTNAGVAPKPEEEDTSGDSFAEDLSNVPNQLPNGGFESNYDHWFMTSAEKAAYTVYDSPTDIWGNPVNATGHYLYGFTDEAFADANFHSDLFKVGGSGIITWKMAGNCTENLQFILMQYHPEGEDTEIARFNNWYFPESQQSGFIFWDYYYQIDLSKYQDAYCYLVVKDADNGGNGFGFLNLDDIVTYYETAPDTSAMRMAGYMVQPDTDPKDFDTDVSNVPNQLVNGDFESGGENWYLTDEEKAAYTIYDSATDIWGNPVGANGNYLYGFTNEAFANANFYSGLFKVGGTGHITWKMAGNCTEDLQLELMQYNPKGDDVEIAKFNNWYFGTAAESGFIFHEYFYQLDMTKYEDAYCYFTVKDRDNGAAGFGFLNLDDIVTYYESAPDTSSMLQAGFCVKPASADTDPKDFGSDVSNVPNQLVNGDFESGYDNWYLTGEEKAAYTIINSVGDIWGNPVHATNNYIYGFANEAYANANFYSGLFKVGGSGVITWKMAGNCTENLQFILMQYNPEGNDREIARFNNWYYGAYGESGFIFRDYYYQIDEAYAGAYCYFIVKDKDTGSSGFGFINLDDIVTYYETAPDTSSMLRAGYIVQPDTDPKDFGSDVSNVPNQLPNGGFESGYDSWYLSDEEKAAYSVINSTGDIWGNPVHATNHYLYGFTNEAYASADFYSSLFKVGGTGHITWKMAGNCTENLQFILMQYNPKGDDTEIARFNNWYFGAYGESGFIFRDYYYQIDLSKYADAYCYFMVRDMDTGASGFGFLNLDDIVTYYAAAPDVSAMHQAGYCTKPVSADPDGKDFGSDVSNVTNQLVNGNFESGYEGWYMTEEEKAAYTIYGSAADIWGNPVGASGNYLYGYANEAFANANFYSGLFKAEGSGYVTWKMAGNCTDNLQFILMQYNSEGNDVEIARFNNWYFGTVAESGFIFHEYYYQIPAQYLNSYCYFVVKDSATANFAFICLDDIVTYYAAAPDTSAMLQAGFCVKPAAEDSDPKDFGTEVSDVGTQLLNGGFESGYDGWYMTGEEKAAYTIYGSAADIWGNPVGASGNYLYGYANEAFANANFYSGLFKVDGTGHITFKIAGNCTSDLQFILMQYNPEGNDVEIARFNNWYFGTVAESGFIFHAYYYQIPAQYAGSYCYFVVKDSATANFAFICLDDIVTYYASAPDTSAMLKAGYCVNPEG